MSKWTTAQVHCATLLSDLPVGVEHQRLGLIVVDVHGNEESLAEQRGEPFRTKLHRDGNAPDSPCSFWDRGAVGAHAAADRLAPSSVDDNDCAQSRHDATHVAIPSRRRGFAVPKLHHDAKDAGKQPAPQQVRRRPPADAKGVHVGAQRHAADDVEHGECHAGPHVGNLLGLHGVGGLEDDDLNLVTLASDSIACLASDSIACLVRTESGV